MGGEHCAALVYGFKTDIIFIDDNGFDLCATGYPGKPIYTSIVIYDKDFNKVLEKYNLCVSENHKKISDLNKWAKEKGDLYDRNYECKWQMALYGELEYNDFDLEADLILEMYGCEDEKIN